ncbi:MAG: HlyD family efflux transporter periplasmic adaptor subunit, partial [Oscillospiraceae bacterium]|nr:HlyD family efflux transporter periplasmic adaptor subunit [Oscillospiraceae bacterium]
AEQKKADGKTQATEALDLEAQRKQIEEQTKALAELKAGGEGASVESKVNGIVASVSVSAGRPAEQDAVMMVIEVPDMGYGIDISVTNEQSRKVVPGDTAEVTNYYYGEPITATLVAVKSDPQKPTTNKLLSFRLEGAVESGAQLSLSIGERGANYETRVPNSALRSDSNGSFVLAVVPKSGPLGNRFFARRVDVRVLAADDTYSAVSGGITTSDMVISSATKPVEPGTQVRLAE